MSEDNEFALISDGRKHDIAMDKGPWLADPCVPPAGSTTVRATQCVCIDDASVFCTACEGVADCVPEVNATGIVWMRNNLGPLLNALEAALDDERAPRRARVAKLETALENSRKTSADEIERQARILQQNEADWRGLRIEHEVLRSQYDLARAEIDRLRRFALPSALLVLTDDERKLMALRCRYCGSLGKPCYCQADD